MLRHVSALTFGHLQGDFFSMSSLCFNLEIPDIIKITFMMIKFTILKISAIIKIQSRYS